MSNSRIFSKMSRNSVSESTDEIGCHLWSFCNQEMLQAFSLVAIFTSSSFNNTFSIVFLTYYLPGSQHSYLYADSFQLNISVFMLCLLCCFLTRVHYLLKQEGCSQIKHSLPMAARPAKPITGGKDVSFLMGETCCLYELPLIVIHEKGKD